MWRLATFVLSVGLLGKAIAATPPHRVLAREGTGWNVGQVVSTSSGPVQGRASRNLSDVSEYLGIPYAQPPVGSLRFQPPVKFSGTKPINATGYVSVI